MAPKETIVVQQGATYLPNCNPALSIVSAWVTDAGELVQVHQPCIGWCMTQRDPPLPIVFGGVPGEAWVVLVHDSAGKTWADASGHQYAEWKTIVQKLYAEHDRRRPRKATQAPASADPDHWGVGQAPRPRATSGPRAATPIHPRERDPDEDDK